MGKRYPFVVIQDGWLPEPFDTIEEAKAYKDKLELETTGSGLLSRICIYKLVLAAAMLKLTFGICQAIDYLT